MKKFSRAALLKKKRWTGEDVGQAYIYNLSIQAPGKAAEPIESATLRDKAAGLHFEQFSLYREYMNVYNWLLSEFSMAQATIFHAKSAILELATVLMECESADERRTSLMKYSPIVDGAAVSAEIRRRVDRLITSDNPITFDGEELANIAILYSSGKIPPRDYCEMMRAMFNPTAQASEARREVETIAEQQRHELLMFESDLTAILAARKGENTLDSFDGASLYLSVTDKLKGEKPRVEAPLTLTGLEWYKEYKRDVLALPGIDKMRFSFPVLYYLDFEGIYSIANNTFNPLYDVPRCVCQNPDGIPPEYLECCTAPAGTPTIKERPDDEGSVTVEINPDGIAVDLLAGGDIISDLTERGIYSFTGKGKKGDRLRNWYTTMMKSIKTDIEATHRFNTLIDLVSERVGVAEVKRYKRDFEQLKFGASRFNFTLAEYRARLEFTTAPGKMKYMFDDLEKRTAALDVVNNLMEPIELTPEKEYPAATIERIKEAFEDLEIFEGGVSKIYALFGERG